MCIVVELPVHCYDLSWVTRIDAGGHARQVSMEAPISKEDEHESKFRFWFYSLTLDHPHNEFISKDEMG